MLKMFNKGPKVIKGKETKDNAKKPFALFGKNKSASTAKKQATPLANIFDKFNKMDRKQAYTFGAIGLAVFVALLTLGGALASAPEEDFSDFETRGYDLANMPFSTDEAEKYLLASRYQDVKGKDQIGLYSPEEKAERQAEDLAAAEEAAANTDFGGATSGGSAYVPGRYYGGGGAGAKGTPTQVGKLNSAGLKSAGGSGIKSTFGPTGDFSPFKGQAKGKALPQTAGKGDARTALRQTAQGSRAAAGLKNAKLLNAKKAMMGGDIKGSGAFMDDSGAVNLDAAKGLALDTNAPVSSADMSGFNDAVKEANEAAKQEAQAEEEDQFWREWWGNVLETIANAAIQIGTSYVQSSIDDAIATRQAENTQYAIEMNNAQSQYNYEPITETPTADQVAGNKDLQDALDLTPGDASKGQNPTSLYNKKGTEVATQGADGKTNWSKGYEEEYTLGKKEAAELNRKNFATWAKTQVEEGAAMLNNIERAKAEGRANNSYDSSSGRLPPASSFQDGHRQYYQGRYWVVQNGKWVQE